MADELKCCPHCNRDGAFVEDDGDGYFRVICTCTAMGPLRKGEDAAIAVWNTRAPTEADPSYTAIKDFLSKPYGGGSDNHGS